MQVPEHLIVNEHGGMDKFKFTMIEAILESTVGEVCEQVQLQAEGMLLLAPACQYVKSVSRSVCYGSIMLHRLQG